MASRRRKKNERKLARASELLWALKRIKPRIPFRE
jgi:hypothetical protein